jgi:hypothetical protein
MTIDDMTLDGRALDGRALDGDRTAPGIPPDPRRRRDGAARRLPLRARAVLLVVVSTGLTGWLAGGAATAVSGDRNAPWILGRASGITSYLLLVALVVTGLVLSHPWRTRWSRPSAVARIRIHVSLATFTLAFLVMHIVVLATDEYADVGWWGALLPMASQYRSVSVTFGVLAAYGGLLAGLSAVTAGRWAVRVWWPVHKVAALTLVLTWLHALFAGSDTGPLSWLYGVTALIVIALAASRYMVRGPADSMAEFARGGEGR